MFSLLKIFKEKKTEEQIKIEQMVYDLIADKKYELSEGLSEYGSGGIGGDDPVYENIIFEGETKNGYLYLFIVDCAFSDEPEEGEFFINDKDEGIDITALITEDIRKTIRNLKKERDEDKDKKLKNTKEYQSQKLKSVLK